MGAYSKKTSELPLVRLSLLVPILDELLLRQREPEPCLAGLGFSSDKIRDGEIFVPAPVMYRLVESLCEYSGDPQFGLRVGEKIDPWGWSPLAEAAATAKTVGDFLLRFSINASDDATSVTYVMETVGNRTTFHERRITDGGIVPRHNDGFSIGYLLAIVRSALGENWDGARVIASVSDPDAIPLGYLGIRLARSDTMGASISFPSRWLLLRPQLKSSGVEHSPRYSTLPSDNLIEALRQALRPMLHEPDLDVAAVATLFGVSRRTLSRRMREHGTTISDELNGMRRKKAEQLLLKRELKISEIGEKVGYPDSAVFARAFRKWTGQSPSEFRSGLPKPQHS